MWAASSYRFFVIVRLRVDAAWSVLSVSIVSHLGSTENKGKIMSEEFVCLGLTPIKLFNMVTVIAVVF